MELTEDQKKIWARFKPEPDDGTVFYKVMKKTMILNSRFFDSEIQFPSRELKGNVPFLQHHPEDLNGNATFQLPEDSRQWPMDRLWPVEIVDKKVAGPNGIPRRRVSCFGKGGWRDFVDDNNIRVGELLIFTMIGPSKYRVHRFPERVASNPAFMVTMSDSDNCGKGYVDTPDNSRQRHYELVWDDEIILKGPNNQKMKVKTQEDTHATVCGKHGWKHFSVANNLKVGDRLLFYQTGPSEFDVKLMDQIP